MPNMKAIVVLSGGQDSTTCLFLALKDGYDVHAVTFDYGQRHHREIDAAVAIARFAGVTHEIIELGPVLQGDSPLVSDRTLEQYEDSESLPGGIEDTFVPMRNQLFLTIAANRAYVRGAGCLITGISAEDYGGYPDCRPHFLTTMADVCNTGTFTGEEGTRLPLRILAPLMFKDKRNTVLLALTIGCYEVLCLTHTGYDGAYPPVGKDHATLLRAKGFAEAGAPDPLVLKAVFEGLIDLPEEDNYDIAYFGIQRHILNVSDWIDTNVLS